MIVVVQDAGEEIVKKKKLCSTPYDKDRVIQVWCSIIVSTTVVHQCRH